MLVEDVCKCSMTEITWARYRLILRKRGMFEKIKSGKGLDHADLIEMQKEQKR